MKIKKLGRNLSISLCSILLANTNLYADDVSELDSITVVDKASSIYTTDKKPSISRGNISLENTAKSIQVFNNEFIKDYQAQDIEEIITMSSNVITYGDNNGRESLFALRGFVNIPVLRDGINFSNAVANPDVFNFERVEVLKGPASLQYGRGGAGGLINLVKKKPDSKETKGELQLEATSESEYSTKFDIAGSANEDGSIRYRLVSSYSSKDEDGYNVDTKKVFVAPSLAIDLNDNHTLTLVAEYFDVEEPADFGTPLSSDGTPVNTNDNSILSHPDDDMTSTQKVIGFDLDSKFTSWDSLFKYRHLDYVTDMGDTYLPYNYISTTDTLYRYYAYMYYHNKEDLLQYTLDKEFNTGKIKHNVSVGVDYSILDQEADGYYDFSAGSIYSVDYSNPTYESAMTSLSDHTSAIDFVDGFKIDRAGAFLQDSIEFSEKFVANLGFRSDSIDIEEETGDRYTKSATTPNLGLVYKPTSKASIYATYSESFNLQGTSYTDSEGHLIDPEEGKGVELGIKQKLFDDNFDLSASVFKIDKDNVGIYDTNTLSYYAGETQKSKGFEVDVNGEIVAGWSLLASYGYTSTQTNYYYGGSYYYDKEIVGVPKHSANLFTTYYINPSIYIGGGAKYLGARYANYANTVRVDSDIIYNAVLGYKQKDWSAKLAVKNLTDETYYEAVGASGLGSTIRNNYLGDPRTFVATITYSF